MRLYLKYLKINFKSFIAYRGSSIMAIIGQLLICLSSIISTFLVFKTFGVLKEYTYNHILFTTGIVVFVFTISEIFFRGFDEFDKLINQGNLDTILLRPRGVVLQILGSRTEIMKCFRAILGLVILIYSAINLNIEWTFLDVIIVIEMIVSGILVYFGLFLFISSINIFTIEKSEAMNILTDGSREMCYYPINIFGKNIAKFMTFVIPYASFNYIPLRQLIGMENSLFNLLYPLSSVVFALLGYICFNYCLRFYKSAG